MIYPILLTVDMTGMVIDWKNEAFQPVSLRSWLVFPKWSITSCSQLNAFITRCPPKDSYTSEFTAPMSTCCFRAKGLDFFVISIVIPRPINEFRIVTPDSIRFVFSIINMQTTSVVAAVVIDARLFEIAVATASTSFVTRL